MDNDILVEDCERCPELAKSRSRIVNGRGPKRAKVAVVGQGPGREEDRRGRPFIGPAGRTLSQWLSTAGFDPSHDVYYTNATRCIGPVDAKGKERDPSTKEIENCRRFLIRELNEVAPDIVVPAGGIALSSLYEEAPITQVRGAVIWSKELGCKLVPMLHPASAFHVFSNEKYGIADLRKARHEAKRPDIMPKQLGDYAVCEDVESVESLADLILEEAGVLAVDTETTSLDWQTGKILCVGLSWMEETAFVIPIRGLGAVEYWPKKRDRARVLAALRRILESTIPKVGQNINFDRLYTRHDLGIEIANVEFDTMLAYHLFHEEAGHALETLCNLYTNMGDYGRDARPHKKDMANCPLDIRHKYQAADADCTLRVRDSLEEEFDNAPPERRWVFENITMPLADVAMTMEENGVLVDTERAEKLVVTYDKLVASAVERLHKIKGVPEKFNYRSLPQVRKLLFEDFGLEPSSIVTDKERQPSVKRDALEEIGEDAHPIIPILIRLIGLEQIMKMYLKGAIPEKREEDTYRKGLLSRISAVDNRLHTGYRTDGTETGRFSASPNIQNIAGEAKSAEGAPIREIFIAPPGRVLMSADFSQMELRGLAYISGDENLIRVLESGVDVHDFIARRLFKLGEDEEVSKEDRRKAKTFNFGLGYGMTKVAIARRFKCSEAEAQELLDLYMGMVEKLDDYFAAQRRAVKYRGEIFNIFGRHRLFWGVRTMQHFGGYRRQMGHIYREAYNFPVQSSSSDVHSLATIAVHRDDWLRENGVLLVASIHDSVMLEVDEEIAEEVARHVQKLMTETAYEVTAAVGRPWKVPVDVEWGPRWEDVTHTLSPNGELEVVKGKAA